MGTYSKETRGYPRASNKIGAFWITYNDKEMLAASIEAVRDVVDETVVVDGSPTGPSTDGTAEMLKQLKVTRHLAGVYEDQDGAWDRWKQVGEGLNAMASNVVIPLTADRILAGLANAVPTLRTAKKTIFMAPYYEFWMDTNHLRRQAEGEPHVPTKPFAYTTDLELYILDGGGIGYKEPEPDIVVMLNVGLYHFGWVRPFKDQVTRHVRNIKNGLHGDRGRELNELGEPARTTWAIHHVLRYPQGNSVEIRLDPPKEIVGLMKMRYTDGYEEFIKAHERERGVGFYIAIMNDCPLHLVKEAMII